MLTFDSANEHVQIYSFFNPHSNRNKFKTIVSSRYATSRFGTKCNLVYYDGNDKTCKHVMDNDNIPTLISVGKVLNVITMGSQGKIVYVNI